MADIIVAKYTFTAWCDKEMVGGSDRDSFRRWLGHNAGGERTSREWWQLWDRFVRKTMVKK